VAFCRPGRKRLSIAGKAGGSVTVALDIPRSKTLNFERLARGQVSRLPGLAAGPDPAIDIFMRKGKET